MTGTLTSEEQANCLLHASLVPLQDEGLWWGLNNFCCLQLLFRFILILLRVQMLVLCPFWDRSGKCCDKIKWSAAGACIGGREKMELKQDRKRVWESVLRLSEPRTNCGRVPSQGSSMSSCVCSSCERERTMGPSSPSPGSGRHLHQHKGWCKMLTDQTVHVLLLLCTGVNDVWDNGESGLTPAHPMTLVTTKSRPLMLTKCKN